MDKMDEQIMAVKREELFQENHFQGFKPQQPVDFENRILKKFLFMRRGDAENNPDYKQPIGYVLIANPALKKVFAYRRSQSGGEGRLYGKWSWGVGGHIDKIDSADGNPIRASINRELAEEIRAKIINLRVLGYINDDETPVGRVHFGILYLAETDSEDVVPNSAEIAEGRLRTVQELDEIVSSKKHPVEEWSLISLDSLRAALA